MRDTHEGAAVHHHHINLDFLNWPILGVAAATWATGWLNALWEHLPAPTALYMVISAAFMLFQMADKLGWLHRFKKRPPQEPEEY